MADSPEAAARSATEATTPKFSTWADLLAAEGVRPEVLRFAVLMERKLKANDHKDHWSNCGTSYLLKRLREEVVEVERLLLATASPAPDQIAGETADVANFAMMLADIHKALPRGGASDGTTTGQ